MQIFKINQILNLSGLIYIKSLVFAHGLEQCPPPWQRRFRSKALCNASPDKYSCLYDVIQQTYKESCSGKPDYVKPGKRYVISGERTDDNCIDSRYQSAKLWSNRSSQCEYLKNKCNEIGQALVSNGSTTKDSTCRCDYTKGFDFVIKPKNICYCIPSEEDCSCYRKSCSLGEILTKDYECVSKVNQDFQQERCSPIAETRKATFGTTSTSPSRPLSTLPSDESDITKESHNWFWIFVLLSIAVTCLSILMVVLCNCTKLRTSIQNEQTQSFNVITKNKQFLMEEIDVELMLKQLKNRGFGRGLKMQSTARRRDHAQIICEYLEKQPPTIMCTVYNILQKKELMLILNTLKASERIFRYNQAEILKDRISENEDRIVGCLIKKGLVDKTIEVLVENKKLQIIVNSLRGDPNIDERNEISKIIELLKEDGLESMQQLVYALYRVGEVMYETELMKTQAEYN